MSNQLKLFLYIVFVVAIFLFVQNKFHIFDISMIDNIANKISEDSTSEDDAVVEGEASNYVQIVTGPNVLVKVDVEIADTEVERSLGLSFRKYLGDYNGMLFVFEKESGTPFWMKDMQIPLDMIFFDAQGFIVDIKDAQAPCTTSYCPAIYSSSPYLYVLEVNSGFCENNGVEIGGSLVLHLESLN